MLPAPIDTEPAPSPPEVTLRTSSLRRSFGAVQAVRDVSLELRRGQVYAFLGRNGAGKTTTLRMLIGVLRPDAGEIELLGERGPRIVAAQRQRIGYVSQEQVFYPWMTPRQLGRFVGGFYPNWDPAEYDRLLRVLDVPSERKARHLSGGTRAKLGLALALAHRPPVLIMDEPTAGLDPVARREFIDLMSAQVRREGQAVLFSSHLVTEVEQVSDHVGILQDGVLEYQGSLDALRASHRRLRFLGDVAPALPVALERIRVEQTPPGEHAWIVRAEPSSVDGLAGEGLTLEPLSLEEIFLAYARRSPGA